MAETFNLSNIKCFVFDMDGTIYLGDNLIDGTKELFDYLSKNNIQYYFLTNNSSKSASCYLEKLERLGVDNICRDRIITSGDITIDYLKRNFIRPKVYLIGTPELEVQFKSSEINLVQDINQSIDAVVVGFDTTFHYEKSIIATWYVRRGIPLLATNIDLVCPVEGGDFIPDCGSITSMIESATGRKAKFIGKPFEETANYFLNHINMRRENIAVVGDRLYTDIATGVNNGMCGIAVLTGEITRENIKGEKIQPHFIFEDIKALYKAIKNES